MTLGKIVKWNSGASANQRARGAGLHCKQSCAKRSSVYEHVCLCGYRENSYQGSSGLHFLESYIFSLQHNIVFLIYNESFIILAPLILAQ